MKSQNPFSRFIGLAALLIVSTPGISHAWEREYSCDSDTLVVDSTPNHQGPHAVFGQMVLRRNLARWLFEDLGIAVRSDFNPRGEIILSTNYDERGNLNLAAFMPDNSTRQDVCLKFRPDQQSLVVVQTRDGYCRTGRVVASYQFNECRDARQ